jgi:hypothetical protein
LLAIPMVTGYLEECEGWVEADVRRSTLLGRNRAIFRGVSLRSERLAVSFRWVSEFEIL